MTIFLRGGVGVIFLYLMDNIYLLSHRGYIIFICLIVCFDVGSGIKLRFLCLEGNGFINWTISLTPGLNSI